MNLHTTTTFKHLEDIALKVRSHVVKMATNGGCFIGASLSAVDVLVYLYTEYLNIHSANLNDPERDYLLLSKGHDVPALYGTFVELGLLEGDRLGNHLLLDDHIYWHPNVKIKGVEFHSGSLGHLPSVAIGIAIDIKLRNGKNKVVCVLGDGELNEGTCWEAALVANAYKLDNLIFVIDRNQFQANMATEDLIPLEPLKDKFESFGAVVRRIDGHDFAQIDEAFSALPFEEGKLQVIIADTIRGKGLPSIERRADRWFCNFTTDEIEQLLQELYGEPQAFLTSNTLVVR
ncbi:transketolase [Taibaiella lutea]|uniref:Transketolase n=1 Tax=Taibaiella lutea TaxID=2608001 RepID=A0A5M6CHD5_9BACT|nr:1-deoxy-D-xylulose-5-phosphate synthase N-terminal domain-containing protein [Taibaiella lutea]KAA5534601.1 transketolase [Taibaiella lutea]